MDGMSPIDWSYPPSHACGFNECSIPANRSGIVINNITEMTFGNAVKSAFMYDSANVIFKIKSLVSRKYVSLQ